MINQSKKELGKGTILQSEIINHLPPNQFIFWKDIDGVYLGCNIAFAQSLGFKAPAEVIGKTDYDLPVKKEDSDAYRADDKEVMKTRKPKLDIEEPQTLASGETRILLTNKVPLLSEDDQVYGVLAVYSDITAEKEAEALRLKAIAAEKSVETIRLIGMSVAHELRTPLLAISSGAESILEKLPVLLNVYEKAKEGKEIIEEDFSLYPREITLLKRILGNIKQEAYASFSIIDMLLIKGNLSEIDKNNFAKYKIADCVEQALARYPFQPEEKKLIDWQKGDFVFYGDDKLIVHVLFNLIKNALYFVTRARKGNIQIWIKNGATQNLLHFKDTGTGMSPQILERIFERFFTTESNGTGIGLAFCQLVMQSLGGKIECFSQEGKYTEFVLTFPQVDVVI